MADDVDPGRYPHLARYLAGLPDGLWSHPQSLVRLDVHEPVRRDFPELAKRRDLPLRMTEFLSGDYQADWMGEAIGGALSMLVRDTIFSDDATFYRWRYDEMTKLFKKPMYRVAMFLLSPSAILRSSTRKWSTFHLGSTLTPGEVVENGRQRTSNAILAFPTGLFDETFANLVASTYRAALDCSRAKNAQVLVQNVTPTQVSFSARWEE